MRVRPRRNRARPAIRELVRETRLAPSDLVLPLFVQEGEGVETAIASMPDHARLSIDRLVRRSREAFALGVPAVALFPALAEELKDPRGSWATKPDGLLQRSPGVRFQITRRSGQLQRTDASFRIPPEGIGLVKHQQQQAPGRFHPFSKLVLLQLVKQGHDGVDRPPRVHTHGSFGMHPIRTAARCKLLEGRSMLQPFRSML